MVWVRFFLPSVCHLMRQVDYDDFCRVTGSVFSIYSPGSVGTSEKCLAGSLRKKHIYFWKIFRSQKKCLCMFFFWGVCLQHQLFCCTKVDWSNLCRPRDDAQLPDDSSMFLIGLYNISIYIYISMLISHWIPKTLHRKYREFNENNENWEATLRELLWRYPSEIVPSC